MSTQVTQIRFFEGRKQRFRSRKSSIKGLSSYEVYLRKQDQRRTRAKEIQNSEKLANYIEWIIELQRRTKLSTANFAKRIGVTPQTVKLWKRKSGHFPSERALKKLLELEFESRIVVTFTKIKYGVKM